MTELSDGQEKEVLRVLNSLDPGAVNSLVLELKYGAEWHEEKKKQLEEFEQYLIDWKKTADISDLENSKATSIDEACEKHLDEVNRLLEVCEDSIKYYEDQQ